MRNLKSWALGVIAAAVGFASVARAADNYEPKVVPNELVKIQAAIPTEAYVKPAKPRKLLVYVESKGYYHDSIPVCATALKLMGEKTGAFQVTMTDDPGSWTLDNLNKYDGIFMDNTVGDHPNTDQGKKDFVEYIKSGHGLMGTHAASDCNHPWAEYTNMIGGEFAGHPYGKVSVNIEDPTNPVNAVWNSKGFVIEDETYVFKMPTAKRTEAFSRDNLHVLLSINIPNSHVKPEIRTDGDYGLSWIHEYGKGRVFYCAIGHSKFNFWNPILLKFYLAGIQYALGDLAADATPSAKMNPAPTVVDGPDAKTTPTINPR